jgi:hypothetical protein
MLEATTYNNSFYAIVALGTDLNRISLISYIKVGNNRTTNTTTA